MDLFERFKITAVAESASTDPEEIYENPAGSKWIVAVDDQGNVFVLSRPNIHPNFFECGGSAEEIGLPYDSDNIPGVYEWTCSLNETTDWESGHVDGWTFDVDEEKLLWTWVKNGEADEIRDQKAQSDTGAGKL